jgi:hypothetical protein
LLSPAVRTVETLLGSAHGRPRDRRSLFLTRRTVEMQLTGAYRKLDGSGRQDLPAALAASR